MNRGRLAVLDGAHDRPAPVASCARAGGSGGVDGGKGGGAAGLAGATDGKGGSAGAGGMAGTGTASVPVLKVGGGMLELEVCADDVIRVAFAREASFFTRASLATAPKRA